MYICPDNEHKDILNNEGMLRCSICYRLTDYYIPNLINTEFQMKYSFKNYTYTYKYDYKKNIRNNLIKNRLLSAYFQDYCISIFEIIHSKLKNNQRLTRFKNYVNTMYMFYYQTDKLFFSKLNKYNKELYTPAIIDKNILLEKYEIYKCIDDFYL